MIKRWWDSLIRLVRRIPFVDKHFEIWVYIFFGGLTTAVSWLVYFLFSRFVLPPLGIPTVEGGGTLALLFGGENLLQAVAKAISWFLSVAFAFFTNRAFVFKDPCRGLALWAKLGAFYLSRTFSGVVFDMGGFILLNAIMPDTAALVITSVFVIFANYFFSKLLIFKKKKTVPEKPAEATSERENDSHESVRETPQSPSEDPKA